MSLTRPTDDLSGSHLVALLPLATSEALLCCPSRSHDLRVPFSTCFLTSSSSWADCTMRWRFGLHCEPKGLPPPPLKESWERLEVLGQRGSI